MKTCVVCETLFPSKIKIENKWYSLWGRKRCFECLPHHPTHAPRITKATNKEIPKEKKCNLCKDIKLAENFGFKTDRGKKVLQAYCRECNKKYRKAHYKGRSDLEKTKNKEYKDALRKKFHSFLKQSKCVDCGESRIQCLEFDHIDRKNKKCSVTKMVRLGYKWEKICKEIDKCVVRCRNCHVVRTAEQFNWIKQS